MLCLLQSRERKRKFKLVRQQEKEQDDGGESVNVGIVTARREGGEYQQDKRINTNVSASPGQIDVLIICSIRFNRLRSREVWSQMLPLVYASSLSLYFE